MKRSAPHLSNHALARQLAAVVGHENTATAIVLDHIAEFDARKLYLPAAYPSMFAYCVGELHLSDDAAYKRIQAGRAARRFPAIFDAVAEGRVHLSGICLLAPWLTEETADELMAAATHKSKLEIEKLLAGRFPRPDMPARMSPVQLVPEVGVPEPVGQAHPDAPALQSPACQLAPGQVGMALSPPDRSKVQPIAPQRYAVQFTISQGAHDKLRYLQDLLGFEMPSGDLGRLFEDALDARIREVEKRKLAATNQPRTSRRGSSRNPRHIPAHVRRAVWKRDGARCTFVSEAGRRCEARKGLQFDHALEVARGGEATVNDIRLRCWAHNQYTAECTFGAEFMRHKRIAAAEVRAEARERRARGAPC